MAKIPFAIRVLGVVGAELAYSPSNFSLIQAGSDIEFSKRGNVSPTNDQLLHNSIGFAVIPFFSLALRCVNKIYIIKAIHIEDLCMLAAMSFYISLLVLINVSASYATNLYPVEEAASILANPTDVADRILGSKIVIGLEQSMMAVTWLVKLCIWFFLKRVCANVRNYEIALYTLLVYIILGFLIVEIAYYAILCQPFSQYWAMPVKNPECTTYHNYSVIQMVFNISSDLFLFFLPTWIVLRSKMLPKQRLICLVPFSLAMITIIFAVLNKLVSPNPSIGINQLKTPGIITLPRQQPRYTSCGTFVRARWPLGLRTRSVAGNYLRRFSTWRHCQTSSRARMSLRPLSL